MKINQEQWIINIRFYEELNDFLRPSQRKRELIKKLNHQTTVKDVIESFGVPHTEVDLALVNGKSVPFDYLLHNGDRISVYPVFESLDISPMAKLQERPLRNLKFVTDVHLGKLTRFLRLLGFDVYYRNDQEDYELLQIMEKDHRVLLTRDRHLLMHRIVERGYWLRSQNPPRQALEVVKRFDLWRNIKPFKRCLNCNGVLESVPKKRIQDNLEPKTKLYYRTFVQCRNCENIYWKGSHYARLKEFVDWIITQNGNVDL